MAENPDDEQRWTPPSNEDLPGGATPPLQDMPGADEAAISVDPPPGGGPAPAAFGGEQSSGKATASLVLGILGIFICPFVLSVLALVFGYSGRKEIDASGGRLGNRGVATAGIVLGWVGIAIGVLWVILAVLLIAVSATTTSSAHIVSFGI